MKRGLTYQRHVHVPINYDGITFEHGLKIDLLVEGQVICKVKAAEFVNPVLEAQVVSHLKITGNRMGFVINFYVVNMNQGIRRVMI
jgi:GxxExxY protein